MPSDPQNFKDEVLTLKRAVKAHLETAQLFGEDELLATVTTGPVIGHPHRALFVPRGGGPPTDATCREDVSVDKKMKLDALYARYSECQNCPLGKSRNKIVFGMGSLDPKVLFVGEGPGYEEDRKGLPFVGRAGELLDKILASIGLDRNNVYIANIVKCHPMKNPDRPDLRGNDRPPEFPEMEACRPILEEQIEILDPPVICALGSISAKALLRTEDGIMRLRGKIFDFTLPKTGKTIPLLPTYHPAALLRNELLKKDVWQDMKLLKSLIQGS